jgi:hypothetical protein
VDLLAEQSEDALRRMREDVRAELARLTVEAEQIDQALARKNRRARTGGGRLSREQVFDLVMAARNPLTAAEVHQAINEAGIHVSLNAVRNHLTRLEEDGRLLRTAGGAFGPSLGLTLDTVQPRPTEPDPEPSDTDDDLPF